MCGEFETWNKAYVKLLILGALALIVAAGCSSGDTTVRVGEPGQKGVVRTDIDQSRGVAQQASQRVHEGDAALAGN